MALALLFAWAAWEALRCYVFLIHAAFAFIVWREERQYYGHRYHGSRYWDCLIFTREELK